MCEEHELCEKALRQCAGNFVDGIIQFVSSEKEYYKFIITSCKENTNMIMELVFSLMLFNLLVPCTNLLVTFFLYYAIITSTREERFNFFYTS